MERQDEEGYATRGRLSLASFSGQTPGGREQPLRRVPLVSWVPYGEAREAARALAAHTGIPLEMDQDVPWTEPG